MTTLAATSQLTDDCDTATATGSADRVIRISTAVAVLAVAGVAAYVSYWHAYAVVRAHGETGITARLEPATIDGLVYASSMVVLYAARHRLPVPSLARWLLGLGIAATLTANMAQGWSHGPVGAAVAAWPAISLVGSYELLVWLVRTAGRWNQPQRNSRSATVRRTALGHAGSRPRPLTASGGDKTNATRQIRHNKRSASPPRSRPSRPARSAPRKAMTSMLHTAKRWPRTGGASKLEIRCRNASSPGFSDALPAAGPVRESPRHGNYPGQKTSMTQ
jgi:hypothetical protein